MSACASVCGSPGDKTLNVDGCDDQTTRMPTDDIPVKKVEGPIG